MNIQNLVARATGNVQVKHGASAAKSSWIRSNCGSISALSAARARLSATASQNERHRTISANGEYYGEKTQLEETIDDTMRVRDLGAIVTRNHYGSLVLNAYRALFIDVDMLSAGDQSPPFSLGHRHWEGPWRRTLEDLCLVLSSESQEGFRIYRTAAGFRVLSTTREFEPGSERSERLMNLVGADPTFMHLCRVQKTFRARLTPKPWRCGAERPPNLFPRRSVEEQQCFANWLARYERACGDRATCQFLEHVGPGEVRDRIAPVVEVHDRTTKAHQPLALA